jgi:hypothetical protein
MTFWYGSGSADPYQWTSDLDPRIYSIDNWIRILLFSSVADKMPTKISFLRITFWRYIYKVFLTFCLLIEGSGSGQNNEASWSGGPKTSRSGPLTLFYSIPYWHCQYQTVTLKIQGPVYPQQLKELGGLAQASLITTYRYLVLAFQSISPQSGWVNPVRVSCL